MNSSRSARRNLTRAFRRPSHSRTHGILPLAAASYRVAGLILRSLETSSAVISWAPISFVIVEPSFDHLLFPLPRAAPPFLTRLSCGQTASAPAGMGACLGSGVANWCSDGTCGELRDLL